MLEPLPITIQVLLGVGIAILGILVGPPLFRMVQKHPLTLLPLLSVPALALWLQSPEPQPSEPPPLPKQVILTEATPPQAPSPKILVVHTKPNVRPQKLDSQLVRALPTIVESFQSVLGPLYQPVITSANDGEEHHLKSAHYRNQAIDFRANNMRIGHAQQVQKKLQHVLGGDFLVLLESVGTPNQHFHIQIR